MKASEIGIYFLMFNEFLILVSMGNQTVKGTLKILYCFPVESAAYIAFRIFTW